MNQYTLWKWKSGKWQRQGTIYAASAQAALDNQGGNWVYDMSILADNPSAALESAGGNYSPSAIPQCITNGSNSNPSISSNILAGYNP